MTKELKKRIITSIILLTVSIPCILINKYIFTVIAFFVLFISINEWININFKYFHETTWKYNLINFLGIIYVFFVFFSAFNLRGDTFDDGIFFIFILCICVGSDIGGYILGKIIGGKKLIKISPNKTIAGSIGSFIFSTFPLFLFNLQNFIDFNFGLLLKNILFCLIISLSCQIGDLIISYFKRLNKVKDTGNILPGHGGLLDRVDGLIFALPTAHILKITQMF